jgi:two-component system nitrogen regulation response regulator GlnG
MMATDAGERVVWIVDDDSSVRWVLDKALSAADYAVRCFQNSNEMLDALTADQPDILITDIKMPGMDGLELLQRIQAEGYTMPTLVMTAHADLDSAVAAYRAGAFEYLPKPFDVDEAVALVGRAARASENVGVREEGAVASMSSMIGQAAAMQEVFRTIGRLSRSSMNVLITGESGTGKELVARALHAHSPRVDGPFIALNTTAIAAELLESELFGHERGAFTGADARRLGRFEQADHGTLFLDEIGDMSANLQTRLLRVLAEGEFYRVGGQSPISVDVRVVAATNQDLTKAVEAGTFREDLYHRLNVIRINTPPLRDRSEDIPLLLRHYLNVVAEELGIEQKRLSADAEARLKRFDWPGNVRQLINVCRRLIVAAPGADIQIDDIPAELGSSSSDSSGHPEWIAGLERWCQQELDADASIPLLEKVLPEFEQAVIRVVLAKTNGRRQEAAEILGMGRNTLARKIRQFKMDV